jgi:hypothetical protein
MQAPVFGSFGAQPGDVLSTEFFSFFHLTEAGRDQLPDGRTSVAYRSPSPMFHELTWVDVVSDGQGIARVALSLYERFVAHPNLAVYARDIAKSFIGDGIATSEDAEKIGQVARDIFYRPMTGAAPSLPRPDSADELRDILTKQLDLGKQVTAVLGSGPQAQPELPEVYSRGYAVYIGERATFTADLSMTQFSMRNETAGEDRLLTIAFDRRD